MNGPQSQDPWDRPLAPSNSKSAPGGRNAAHVPESWDDEEEEIIDPTKIWQEANNRTPMPEVLIQTGATTSIAAQAAIQPKMSILKRPKNAQSTPTTPSGKLSSTTESLKEKEARYREARERIFGQGTHAGDQQKEPSTSPQPGDITPSGGTERTKNTSSR